MSTKPVSIYTSKLCTVPRKGRPEFVITTKFDPTSRSERVTELLLMLQKDMDAFARRTISTIRRDVVAYRSFPVDVHTSDNVINLRNLVSGLIRFTPPDDHALTHARFMGRQRALAHVRLSTATEGYHVAYGAVWQELLHLAQASGDERAKEELTGYVTPLWTWFHQMSAAFTAAYLETESAMKATRSDTRAIVHEALRSDLVAEQRSQRAIAALGFEHQSPVTVLVSDPIDPGRASAAAARFADLEYKVEMIAAAPETVVLSQAAEQDAIVKILQTEGQARRVGIGRTHPNFDSAPLAHHDALRALSCTSGRRPIAYFAQVWPIALAVENGNLVSDFLARGLQTVHQHPPLAETVRAFARNRFSLTATAAEVHLHPNTAKYRLDRWKEHTGWDVYTAEGLLKSLACLDLADLDATNWRDSRVNLHS